MRSYLEFISTRRGIVYIDEPVGYDGTTFTILQEDNRKARDVNFATGENLTLNDLPEHAIEFVIESWEQFGTEAVVNFGVEINETLTVIGRIDFTTAETDERTFFNFAVIDTSNKTIFRTRLDRVVNLFGDKTADDDDINPCQVQKIWLKSYPTYQRSKWSLAPFDYGDGQNEYAIQDNGIFFNPLQRQDEFGVADSLNWLQNINDNPATFKVITAATNLRDVKIRINLDVLYKYRPTEAGGPSGKAGSLSIYVYYGQSLTSLAGVMPVFYQGYTGDDNQDFQLPPYVEANIPFLNATDGIWIFWRVGSANGAVNRILFRDNTNINISVTSIEKPTVINAVRYIDALKYAVDVVSEDIEVSAPIFEEGGEYYDLFITNTPQLRNIAEKPFNFTLKDTFEGFIQPMFNGDYRLTDTQCYVGLEQDFYPRVEIANYLEYDQAETEIQATPYSKVNNDRYNCNLLELKYASYSSQKEQEVPNSYSILHGDSQWDLRLKFAKNTKQVDIKYIFDASLTEENRRKSFDTDKSSATQDDDKVYGLDAVYNSGVKSYIYTFTVQHRADGNYLSIRNDQSFSWVDLGIVINSQFEIQSGANQGNFQVVSVTPYEIKLFKEGSWNNVDIENTTVKYYIDPNVVYIARTVEGFDEAIEDVINQRFTIKRILTRYYNNWLATQCFFNGGKPIRNTLYNYNAEATTKLTGQPQLIEAADFLPTNPTLTPFQYNITAVMTFSQFLALRENTEGFIRVNDSIGLPVKGFIRSVEWKPLQFGLEDPQGAAAMELEPLYEPYVLELVNAGNGIIIINGATYPSDFDFTFDNLGKISIFDANGRLIIVPVRWDRVAYNGAIAQSAEQLALWLNSI